MSSCPGESVATFYQRLATAYHGAKAALGRGDLAVALAETELAEQLLAESRLTDDATTPAGSAEARDIALTAHADLLALALSTRDTLRAEISRCRDNQRALRGYRRGDTVRP